MQVSNLIDDDEILVTDVRCSNAPRPQGSLEKPGTLEIVIPLAGVFERTVYRSGSARSGVPSTADPSRIHLFLPAAPYRVAHPLGGTDRSLAIAIRAGWSDLPSFPNDIPAPPIAHAFARRLAAAVARGTVDDLAAGEAARHLVDQSLGWFDHFPVLARRGEASTRQIRLEIAASLRRRTTLAELGRRVGLSGWEAARRFRMATGSSIHQYRTALRIQAALERIEAGERDLTALALDLGFADHSHLANVLRRAVGQPPSAFRPPPTPSELAALRTILQA
jgi:AraC family transcriptional regulator